MYEYKTETYYGSTPPATLNPPSRGFRLNKIEPIKMNGMLTHTMNYECDSIGNRRPYVTCSNESYNYNWLIIWERYVPEEEREDD